jgi:hypothetical protein
MNRAGLILLLISLHVFALAQSPTTTFVDFTGAGAKFQGSAAASVQRLWSVKAGKFKIGTGLRITSYFAANQYYATAPAKLTSGKTGPLVFFTENIPANIDSFLIKTPQVNALNAMISVGYEISPKGWIGFNIDAIGFSFGGKTRGNYINGFAGANTESKPTTLNALLISDNDWGTLNSELYGKYFIADRWSVKAGLQFLFTEYTTKTKVQQQPKPNDRFRRKSLLVAVGFSRSL